MGNTYVGVGIGEILAIIFVVLKLTGTITWSWWWVFSPIWIPFSVIAAFFGVAIFVISIKERLS